MNGLILEHAGNKPRLDDMVFVAETATVIGNVEIGSGSGIWYGVVLRGDINRIRIGRNTNIQDNSVVHVNHDQDGTGGDPTFIGDNVTVGHMALLHACTIESDAFIGMRSVVMDRAVVEAGAMVAAGAVVTPGKVVRSGQLWAGAPARHMRDLTRDERARFAYLARHYKELAARYLEERA